MTELLNLKKEIKRELTDGIIPFWKKLRDDEYGGYYGEVDYELKVNPKAEKGCILNSRITWFFANAYTVLRDESLLDEARHAYEFLRGVCIDRENGGIYWSMSYDGRPLDTTKHTYNQAFCIYALSSYYEASGDKEALELAFELYNIIETKCTDSVGYLEAFTKDFKPESNEKLSENGVMADKTMNTLLHVFEAYTELYRVSGDAGVRARLEQIMDLFADKIYNPELKRQEVFFDAEYNSIIDLHSYGHDIETAWLIDRGAEVVGDKKYLDKMTPITRTLTEQIYRVAFNGHSLANECDKGVVNTLRIWWVQAETLVGFLNGYLKDNSRREYLDAVIAEWDFIKTYQKDPREGSEWFREVYEDGSPMAGSPLVEPWKCPYHNGRMCLEVIKRIGE
ncbi:MAG: AGE family epimerase/isomerase [Butyrivibrio sp.]|nr:AGE family epimerase/isomerase [Butyrivibrio sp.]